LTEAEQQYFDIMDSLFAHPGWKVLADDIQGWQEAITAGWRTVKPDQLAFEQGRAAAFDQVLEHFKLCESLKAQALSDDENVEEAA
jgi:hypothetical protein